MNKNLSNLTSNDGEKEVKTMKQNIEAELLEKNTSNSVAAESVEITDPNNIVQTTFNELKKLPESTIGELGEATVEIKYQQILIPTVTVKFKK